jgi:hypothetical protein
VGSGWQGRGEGSAGARTMGRLGREGGGKESAGAWEREREREREGFGPETAQPRGEFFLFLFLFSISFISFYFEQIIS